MRAPQRRSSVTTPSTVSFGPSSRRPRPLGSSSSPSTPSPSASALFLPPRTSAHRPRTRWSSSRRLDSTDSPTRADCPTRTGLHAKGSTSRRGHLWRCDDVRGRQHGTAPVLEVRPPRPSLLRSPRADSPARTGASLQVLRPRHRLALVLRRLGSVLCAAGGVSGIRRLDLRRSSSHDSPVHLAPHPSTRTSSSSTRRPASRQALRPSLATRPSHAELLFSPRALLRLASSRPSAFRPLANASRPLRHSRSTCRLERGMGPSAPRPFPLFRWRRKRSSRQILTLSPSLAGTKESLSSSPSTRPATSTTLSPPPAPAASPIPPSSASLSLTFARRLSPRPTCALSALLFAPPRPSTLATYRPTALARSRRARAKTAPPSSWASRARRRLASRLTAIPRTGEVRGRSASRL